MKAKRNRYFNGNANIIRLEILLMRKKLMRFKFVYAHKYVKITEKITISRLNAKERRKDRVDVIKIEKFSPTTDLLSTNKIFSHSFTQIEQLK